MLTEFEGKVVKSLETIAECSVKSNEMAKEAFKKSNQLYEANMAMIKESQIELQTPDSNTLINECEDEEEEDEDMPF